MCWAQSISWEILEIAFLHMLPNFAGASPHWALSVSLSLCLCLSVAVSLSLSLRISVCLSFSRGLPLSPSLCSFMLVHVCLLLCVLSYFSLRLSLYARVYAFSLGMCAHALMPLSLYVSACLRSLCVHVCVFECWRDRFSRCDDL